MLLSQGTGAIENLSFAGFARVFLHEARDVDFILVTVYDEVKRQSFATEEVWDVDCSVGLASIVIC